METRITDDEAAQLAYLHENAAGFAPRYCYTVDHLARETGLDEARVVRAVTYLEQWGLVGFNSDWAADADVIGGVYLTGLGEAYMREVESRLQEQGTIARGKRFGLAALRGVTAAAVTVATGVLTELAKRRLPP